MTTITKRPSTINQTTGSYATGKYYRSWSDLNNLKSESDFATCGKTNYIGGKNGTYPRPAPLKLTNFKFNIPSTAKITKITVYYRHYKPKISGAYPSISAPTIDLLNVSADAKKGSAVPTSSTEYSVSWSISPSVSKVNSSSFGVSINYPANANTNPGQVKLRNVRIVVTYTNSVTGTSSSTSSGSSSSSSDTVYIVGSDGYTIVGTTTLSDLSNQTNNSSSSTAISSVSSTGANVSKSKCYIWETVDLTLTISASSKITASVIMYIALPLGVEYVSKKSGNGTIDNEISNNLNYQGSENYYWQADFSNSTQASITFTVRINTVGTKTLTFREETTNKTTSVKITGEPPSMPLSWGDFKDIATTEESAEFSLICTNNINIAGTNISFVGIEKTFEVTFPAGVTVTWDDSDFTVVQNGNVHTITKTIETNESYFPFTLSFSDLGTYTLIVEDGDNTFSRTIKVRPSNLTLPYFSKIVVDEHVRDRLGNSKEYTLSSLMKVVIEDSEYVSFFESYDYNYRIGVFNTNLPDGYTDEYLLENTEWSNPISALNIWEELKVDFFYSKDYPLIFIVTGEYIESIAEEASIQYTYPCLIEEEYRNAAESPGLFEYPIQDLTVDEGATSLDLKQGEVTNITKLYDIDFTNFLESDDDNRIIQGVTVYFDVLTCDNPISIMAQLVSPSFTKDGNRSLNIESIFQEVEIFQGIVSLGGQYDLWGLDWDDFKLSKLEDLEIDLQFLNNFQQDVHIEFNNPRIVFHYVELEESKIISKVNGVDLRYFNVFIKDVIIKPGTNNDVKYLEVEGTDSKLPYRSNIREKEIEMEIRVPGCDIEETTTFVERLASILTTKRDKFNKPILNEIEFSHKPNRIWKYLLEDELDVSVEFTEYEGKIKLIVPEGTAYSKEPTITNATGTNSGIAKVNPIIRVIAQDTSIIVKETISNQEWRLTDDSLEVGDIVRIDCGERKAYKVEGQDDDFYDEDISYSPDTDITEKVDFNSDWFLIQDDYNFECENTAIIQSVSFYERW